MISLKINNAYVFIIPIVTEAGIPVGKEFAV